MPCSVQKPGRSQRLQAGRGSRRGQGQAGWACVSLPLPLPILRSLLCPQWSQAAPMAEGGQKPHEGKRPPPPRPPPLLHMDGVP